MDDWILEPSVHSMNTENPVRETVSSIKLPTDFPKPTYSLALGDPSYYTDFAAHSFVVDAVVETLRSGQGNGYTDSLGYGPARETLSRAYSYDNIRLTKEDVIIDIGGTGAIHTILQVFLNPGDNILISSPGFPLYKTMAQNLKAEAITYNLKPFSNWEVDLEDLERKVTPRTKMIVVVNPCNPCGSVFSKEHLMDILNWAERHHVCILADEVYHGMTFGKPHYPLGSLTDTVPVFTVGALSKMFLVPGWRCGWVLIYDKYNKCEKYRPAINKIKNMLLHPVPFIMQAIPKIYENLPQNYFAEVMQKVKERAEVVKAKLADVSALNTGTPEGSLYCMVAIDFTNMDVKSSVEFAQKLAHEEGVVIMPAEAFLSHSAFRIVLCHPIHVIEECMDRIKSFIQRHTI
ncbi:hypothetical protein SteCoe_24760 [Stentor coeruleus]|uniref:Aminotransferase class I/classII large domain-containing protein n=1 Tax=Stentor coeruleus TaxID=5963 RepID=A0A1R2BGV7_9CILI|nr:hypothetical protein SteCoe_24760 [Stentor coeruleus]